MHIDTHTSSLSCGTSGGFRQTRDRISSPVGRSPHWLTSHLRPLKYASRLGYCFVAVAPWWVRGNWIKAVMVCGGGEGVKRCCTQSGTSCLDPSSSSPSAFPAATAAVLTHHAAEVYDACMTSAAGGVHPGDGSRGINGDVGEKVLRTNIRRQQSLQRRK